VDFDDRDDLSAVGEASSSPDPYSRVLHRDTSKTVEEQSGSPKFTLYSCHHNRCIGAGRTTAAVLYSRDGSFSLGDPHTGEPLTVGTHLAQLLM
jgi:hypothetical protein